MNARRALLWLSAAAATAAAAAPLAHAEPSAWSPPATPDPCPSTQAPVVAFPSDSPTHSTGWGAVVWQASPTCAGGAGARIARIGDGDIPGPSRIPSSPEGRPLRLTGPFTASGGPNGWIVIAGQAAGPGAGAELIQGFADGPFYRVVHGSGGAAPAALASAYLGDVAVADAAPGPGGPLQVSLERHFATRFAPPAQEGRPAGQVHALTVALDYRSEAVLVWQQDGWLYAREVPAIGPAHRIWRLAPAVAGVRVVALLSDDNRAIVAWSEQLDGATSVYLDRSGAGVTFGAPQLLERFADPSGLAAPAASPRLVRLSSESVMMAWAGAEAGRWVVRTAAVDLHGLRTVGTIAAPGGDALLDDLVPGPNGEALAMWSEPAISPGGTPDLSRQAIFTARGFDEYPGFTHFGTPEQVAPPGPNDDATLAIDPGNGAAVAVWLGQSQALSFAVRQPQGGS